MGRLSRIQNDALRRSHKSNPKNRSKFFDCVSLVTIRGRLNEEKSNFLQEMTKLSINAKVRMVND